MTDLADVGTRFAHLLHAAGLPTTPERAGRFAEAVVLTRAATTDELYWAARVTLVGGPEQVETFDRVFAQVFGGRVDPADHRGDPNALPLTAPAEPGPNRSASRATVPGRAPSPAGDPAATAGDDGMAAGPASAEALLRAKDLAACTPEELVLVRRLIADLVVAAPRRPGRRTERHHQGGAVDVRSTLRRAHRTGGDPAHLERRRRRDRPRRVVLLADVSGSMSSYSRAYLHLLHSAVRACRAEAFVFSTRLTRLTRALATSQPDVALARAVAATPDWSSGTRLGEVLQAFNDGWGRRGLARRAVVVVVSDGWDAGDPALVAREMQRLRRLAHRIVWVNPRSYRPGYAPLVGGMAAALPFVDDFLSGHSVDALRRVVDALAG